MRFTNLTRQVEIGANSYLLEIAGKKVVLDSGMHPRETGQNALPRLDLPGNGAVDAIFISHSHHDHIGTLPLLQRAQPSARIFMTEETHALTSVMLHNSVNVMTKIREQSNLPDYPLFTHREVDRGKKRWQKCQLNRPFSIDGERIAVSESTQELSFELFDAGHVLGSAGTLIRGEGRTVFYTGDVNFRNQTLSIAADFPQESLDVLIMETTHGDTPTPEGFSRESEQERLGCALQSAFERGGCVLMPLFALGKTQELLAMVYEFRRNGILPESLPVYIGGLGAKLTEIYDKFADSSVRRHSRLQLMEDVAPFVIAGRDASLTALNGHFYALSSGMMTEKTLSNRFARSILSEPQHSLFFIGYTDPNSPGGKIRATAFGESIALDSDVPAQPLRCHREDFSFSGHAAREDLRAYANKTRPKKIVLVHGDPPAVEWFRATLSSDLPESEIIVPPPGEALEI